MVNIATTSETSSRPIRILIADDHEIVLEGIRTLLARSGRPWEICAEAHDGSEALTLVKQLRPDVAILDVTMPEMSGLEAAKAICRSGSDCRLLMFTMHESERLGEEAVKAGAKGYVVKSQAARDLIRAVDFILAGQNFFGRPPGPDDEGPDKPPTKDRPHPGGLFRIGLVWA